MRVNLRNPDRQVEVDGPRKVRDVLFELGIDPDTVLVIRNRALITREQHLEDADEIEVRPVISGGARGGGSPQEAGAPESEGERAPRWRRAATT
jgi:sulfur carrier protein ThiS